jgi:hypothetical protein
MPRIQAVARHLESIRANDPTATEALHGRETVRLQRCREVVDRLRSEGSLRPGLERETAAVVLWSLTSHGSWEAAREVAGWTTEEWVEHTAAALEAALVDRDRLRTRVPRYGAEIAGDLADFGAQLVELRYRREHPLIRWSAPQARSPRTDRSPSSVAWRYRYGQNPD